jgi:hypothetical protein
MSAGLKLLEFDAGCGVYQINDRRRGPLQFFVNERRIKKYPAMYVMNDDSLSQHRS